MSAAVQVIWWVGLVAALGLTLVAVKLLGDLLRTVGDLRTLAERTARAADGIAEAFAGPLRLEDAAAEADGLRTGAVALRDAAARVLAAVDGPAGEHRREARPEGDGIGAGELGGAGGGPGSGGGGGGGG